MKASKIGLLLLILAFGSTVETAWRVRNHFGLGSWGWWALGGKFKGPSFTFEAGETQKVAADTPVEVENAFGGVSVVQGEPGEVRIALRKVVFLPTEEKARAFAERIQLQTRREGGLIRVATNRTDVERASSGLGFEVGFQTHLELTVPPATAVKVSNEHGAVQVSDVARADVSGSYDVVRVERVAGPARITGRHGDVRAAGIKGELTLANRHGDTTIEDVEGRATVEVEHGDVEAARVGGLVVRTAHGEVRAEAIRGDLEVHARHSEVRAADVTGRALVETSFRKVTLERVGGDAEVRSEHGDVSLSDVKGAVSTESSFDDVSLARIGGAVTVSVRHGGLRAQGLEKGARVKASGNDVVLDGFRGPVEIEVERAAVRLMPGGAIADMVKVTTQRGEIELEVPPGSRFDLEASSERGEISVDVPGLDTTQTGTGRLTGRLGGGGIPVVLRATHADVRLRAAVAFAQSTP